MSREQMHSFPRHTCGFYLEHNDCRTVYQTVMQHLQELADRGSDNLDWESEDHKRRAVETNEIWTLQWYPETPIGSYTVAAPTLEELLAFAATYDK